ncbi:hypothetical protein CK203_044684 [Vitis vinifera]|uniref:DUF4283 domain-containing protein n=1 Tax=Vitis vinifera TaxID=29760 RepID=A0A438H9C4_VITVI|nr:hypothetical protein CK203_044684 [Vitis vinifera]
MVGVIKEEAPLQQMKLQSTHPWNWAKKLEGRMKSGGSVWFGVDSKSFEISVESLNGKLSRVITESGRSFSSWIRFGERGLSLLLEGVETCCQKEGLKVFNNSWLEGGFSYVAMRRAVKVEDGPKPQHDPVQKDLPLKVDNVSKDWKSESESVWLQFGGVDAFNKMHILNRCLVGQWGDFSDDAPLLSPLKEWARYHWRLKGNLSLSSMGGALILFEFESTKEVERVLQEGEWIYKQKFLFLERWAPTTGRFREGVQAKSAWWARVLVQTNGREAPGKLQVVVGDFCFTVYLWWELAPWVVVVTSSKERLEAGKKKLEGPRAPARVGSEGMFPEGELSITKGPSTAETLRLEQ